MLQRVVMTQSEDLFRSTLEFFLIIHYSSSSVEVLKTADFWPFTRIFCGNFLQKSACSDQGASQNYEIMLETCSEGTTYPRTKKVWYGNV